MRDVGGSGLSMDLTTPKPPAATSAQDVSETDPADLKRLLLSSPENARIPEKGVCGEIFKDSESPPPETPDDEEPIGSSQVVSEQLRVRRSFELRETLSTKAPIFLARRF